jgi:hypothetical protein
MATSERMKLPRSALEADAFAVTPVPCDLFQMADVQGSR